MKLKIKINRKNTFVQVKQQLEAKYYDRFFEENYIFLKRMALKITKENYEDSDDLLHDFYVKLSQTTPVENPKNVNAYLFIALKNSYRSVIRKRMINEDVLSFDEEFLSNTLLDEKTASRLTLEEKLRAICHYACLRKETSISGSVVLLRYFHGYFASEVSRIIRRSRNAVEARLVAARHEISQYLTNPDSVQFSLPTSFYKMPKIVYSESAKDLLTELRREIYSFRLGDCLTEDEYDHLYQTGKDSPTRKILSHLVSCTGCLNAVNKTLKLPKLSSRHPLDSVRETMFGLLPFFFGLVEIASEVCDSVII
jgi:RNA polymerase sigma factor (sigma-70 family)